MSTSFRDAHVARIREIEPERARIVEKPVLNQIEADLVVAVVALDDLQFHARMPVRRAVVRRDRRLGLPVLGFQRIAQRRGRKIGALLLLGRARVSLRVLLEPLDRADNAVNLAADARVRDDRLLALVQRLDLRGRPLRMMTVAAGLLDLVKLKRLGAGVVEDRLACTAPASNSWCLAFFWSSVDATWPPAPLIGALVE
jgi:hypothetical protein